KLAGSKSPETEDRSEFDASVSNAVPPRNGHDLVAKASLLYGIATVSPINLQTGATETSRSVSSVLVGVDFFGHDFDEIFPSQPESEPPHKYVMGLEAGDRLASCELGEAISKHLGVHANQFVELKAGSRTLPCFVGRVRRFGGPEDSQIFIGLSDTQELL